MNRGSPDGLVLSDFAWVDEIVERTCIMVVNARGWMGLEDEYAYVNKTCLVEKFGIIHLTARKLQNFAEARVRVSVPYPFVPVSPVLFPIFVFIFTSIHGSSQSQIRFSYF